MMMMMIMMMVMVMMMTMMMATMMMMVVMVMMVKTFGTETLDIAPQRPILMNSPSKQGNKLRSQQRKYQNIQNKEKSSDQEKTNYSWSNSIIKQSAQIKCHNPRT